MNLQYQRAKLCFAKHCPSQEHPWAAASLVQQHPWSRASHLSRSQGNCLLFSPLHLRSLAGSCLQAGSLRSAVAVLCLEPSRYFLVVAPGCFQGKDVRPSLAGPFLRGGPLLWAEHRDPPVKDQGLPQHPVCCWEVLWGSACSIHGALHSLTRYKQGPAPCDTRGGSSRRLLWGLGLVSPPSPARICLPAAAGAVVPFLGPPLPHSDTKEPWLLPRSSGSSCSFPWSLPIPTSI